MSFCFLLLAVWKHEWNNNMKIKLFYLWIWQDAKAIVLLKHLISHAKLIKYYFQKCSEESRKFELVNNMYSINICWFKSKNCWKQNWFWGIYFCSISFCGNFSSEVTYKNIFCKGNIFYYFWISSISKKYGCGNM